MELPEGKIRDTDTFVQHFKEEFRGGEGARLTNRQRLVSFEANTDDSLKATCARYARVTEFRDAGTPMGNWPPPLCLGPSSARG